MLANPVDIRRRVDDWLEDPSFLASDAIARERIREWAEPIFGDDGTARLMTWSISAQNHRMVKLLHRLGVSLAVDECGDSPLGNAIRFGDEDMALLLLDLGSNPENLHRNGCNALHMATKLRMYRLMEEILKTGIDLGARTLDSYQTALQIATEGSDLTGVRTLRKFGAN